MTFLGVHYSRLDLDGMAVMLFLLAICAAVMLWQRMSPRVHRWRLRRLMRGPLPDPWSGAIAGVTPRYSVQKWDRDTGRAVREMARRADVIQLNSRRLPR